MTPTETAVVVRRVLPQDWPVVRSLRLEALADTPIAYLETLAAAQELDDATWRARAARGAQGGDSHQALALAGNQPVGTAVSFADDRAAWLVAVYLAPSVRGAGLLRRLVDPCADWAREQGAARLLLEVHEDNARAIAAYLRLGFVATGERRPYPLDPTREELVLALGLRPS